MDARRREGACGGQGADRLRRGLRSGRGEDACRPSDRRRGPAALLAARPPTPSSRCRDGRAAGRPAGIRKSAPSAAFEAGTRYLRQPGRRSMLRQRPPSSNTGPGCLPSTSTTTTGHGTATPSLLTAGSTGKRSLRGSPGQVMRGRPRWKWRQGRNMKAGCPPMRFC